MERKGGKIQISTHHRRHVFFFIIELNINFFVFYNLRNTWIFAVEIMFCVLDQPFFMARIEIVMSESRISSLINLRKHIKSKAPQKLVPFANVNLMPFKWGFNEMKQLKYSWNHMNTRKKSALFFVKSQRGSKNMLDIIFPWKHVITYLHLKWKIFRENSSHWSILFSHDFSWNHEKSFECDYCLAQNIRKGVFT